MHWIVVIILLAILQYMIFSFLVGPTRGKYGVSAPKTVGNDDWERRYRVHQNTMEHLVAFIPAIWLCATYSYIEVAVVFGIIYLLARTHYAYSYIKDPKLRAPGAIFSFFPILFMVLAALAGAVTKAL